MRVLIDTNIFVYMSTDPDMLSRDVSALLQEPETLPCISAESVRELIVGYRNKGLCSKRWKTAEDMVAAIEEEFYIRILPVTKEHMATYARMEINEAQGHKDPSDHIIIAHAITERLPLTRPRPGVQPEIASPRQGLPPYSPARFPVLGKGAGRLLSPPGAPAVRPRRRPITPRPSCRTPRPPGAPPRGGGESFGAAGRGSFVFIS